MTQNNQFNPNEHLMQIKNKQGATDYLPVQWRLVWFREQCPEGTIDTEEITVDLDREVEAEAYVWNAEKRRSEKVIKRARGYARFKAVVTDGKGGRATGTKSESAADFPDYIEKAETGSIGRALAALGYGTQFAPDMDESHRIVDSPVEQRTQTGNSTAPTEAANTSRPAPGQSIGNDTINAGQISAIRKMCEALGRTVPDDLETLASLKAAQLIRDLTAAYNKAKQDKTLPTPNPVEAPAQFLRPSEVDALRAEWVRICDVKEADIDRRWSSFLVYINNGKPLSNDRVTRAHAKTAQEYMDKQSVKVS